MDSKWQLIPDTQLLILRYILFDIDQKLYRIYVISYIKYDIDDVEQTTVLHCVMHST